ncbi:uncharacterized protein [Atheta coriaria]|uniref:uncharacterized protein n=1 Tax=Dalotia coriaria TaxID=877792 RepID=UPI0031F347A0
MIGSAAHFPNSTTLTDDNFDLVWEQLTKFYHNERVLLQSALHAAATMKKMNKESASKLEQLYSTVNQIRNSLELLKRSMAGLDDQLVYATTQRFDPETQKAWELHLGPCQTPPVWTQLSSFIMARSASTSASSSGVKVHHSEAMTENKFHDRPPPSCTLCDELHFLSHCPVFINKTIEQRKDIVNQRRLCYNCLGKHRASACLSSLRCRRCGKRHHTSLHHSTTRPATKDASAVHTNHGSAVQPSCIFLATAKLIIASDNGERIHAHEDPGTHSPKVDKRAAYDMSTHEDVATPSMVRTC